MISRFVLLIEVTNGPDDGLRLVGQDRPILIVLSHQRSLVGQHDVIVDQGSVQ